MPEGKLKHLFYIEVELAADIPVGDVGRGDLLICPVAGGRFEGELLKGRVLPFGADWNLMYKNYLNVIDTRYLLETDDGAIISLSTNGRADIPKELEDKMEAGLDVGPEEYYFRQHLFFECADERYSWLNRSCCVAVVGMIDEFTICYDAYLLL